MDKEGFVTQKYLKFYKARSNYIGAITPEPLFLETHFDPVNAKSDGANMLDLKHLKSLLTGVRHKDF